MHKDPQFEAGRMMSCPGEEFACLADYTRPSLILPRLREHDTVGVVKELSRPLRDERCVPDLLTFYTAVLNHEFLVNSATECGIALPHARLHGITQSAFSFGISPEPFLWGTRPVAPVQFVFLLAVPATDAAGFLQLLSALARLGQTAALLDQLRTEVNPAAIFELFKQVKVRHA